MVTIVRVWRDSRRARIHYIVQRPNGDQRRLYVDAETSPGLFRELELSL